MSDMRCSAAGLAFIARWEGEVLHEYRDAAGLATIGVGHRCEPGSYPGGITHEQAMGLLAVDVGVAEHAVNTQVRVDVGQYCFDALVSFAFNCGAGALAESTTLRLLNAGDLQGAADALLLWDKRRDPASGELVEDGGLLSRRRAERALMTTLDD